MAYIYYVCKIGSAQERNGSMESCLMDCRMYVYVYVFIGWWGRLTLILEKRKIALGEAAMAAQEKGRKEVYQRC